MARIAADLADILNGVKALIVDAGVVTDAAAFLTVDAENFPPGPAEPPLAMIGYGTIDRMQDTVDVEEVGGDPPTVEMECIVTLWTRVALDQAGQDDSALTSETLGMALLLKQTIDAVNCRDIVDGSDTLTWRPIWFLNVRNLGRWKRDENWRRHALRFTVSFEWKVEG